MNTAKRMMAGIQVKQESLKRKCEGKPLPATQHKRRTKPASVKVAAASAASDEEAPPTKRQNSDEATQIMKEFFEKVYEKSESIETHHDDDGFNLRASTPVVTTEAHVSTPAPQNTPTRPQSLPIPPLPSTSSNAPVSTQPPASNVTSPATNQGKCIWCLTVQDLLIGKKFCMKCNDQGTECAHCHRPMPKRFFTYSQKLCNACYKKDANQKLKRKRKLHIK